MDKETKDLINKHYGELIERSEDIDNKIDTVLELCKSIKGDSERLLKDIKYIMDDSYLIRNKVAKKEK